MFDRRLSTVMGIALAVATASGIGVYQLLVKAQNDARTPTVRVVVAQANLTEGVRITAQDLRLAELPLALVPDGAYRSMDSVVNRITRVVVFAGEAMVPGRLAPTGAGAGLEVRITPGKRAMAVEIDEVAGLAGLIQPDSRVDVLVTLSDSRSETQQARMIMSNMRVLSVGSVLDRAPQSATPSNSLDAPAPATTAALEVTPAQAERLAVAANQGRIQLILRGYGDPDSVSTSGATMQDMLSPAAPLPTAPRRRRSTTVVATVPVPVEAVPPVIAVAPRADSAIVQVFRAGKLTEQRFARPDSMPQSY